MKISNATYPSPSLHYDVAAQVVIFQRVNPDTGEVTFQAPSREVIKEEAHAAAIGADQIPHAAAPKSVAALPTVEPKTKTQAQSAADTPSISILV
jgi:hypothetical protein